MPGTFGLGRNIVLLRLTGPSQVDILKSSDCAIGRYKPSAEGPQSLAINKQGRQAEQADCAQNASPDAKHPKITNGIQPVDNLERNAKGQYVSEGGNVHNDRSVWQGLAKAAGKGAR